MGQWLEATSALAGYSIVGAWGMWHGCDVHWCALMVCTGAASFAWHGWGTLEWTTMTVPCTGAKVPTLATDRPWLLPLDLVATTLLLARLVVLATPPPLEWASHALVQPLLVATLTIVAVEERGQERSSPFIASLVALLVGLLLRFHLRRDRRSLVTALLLLGAGLSKMADWIVDGSSALRAVAHSSWHVLGGVGALAIVRAPPPPSPRACDCACPARAHQCARPGEEGGAVAHGVPCDERAATALPPHDQTDPTQSSASV